jgi:hypothetical protein
MAMPCLQDCIVGVALWIVWYVSSKRLLYPGKVVEVLGAGPGVVHLKVRTYQDNGYMEDAMTLRKDALKPESQIKTAAKQHLDWAFRTSPIAGEVDFQRVLTHSGAEGAGPSQEAKRVRCSSNAGDELTANTRIQQLQTDLNDCRKANADMQARLVVLEGRLGAWDVTVQRMLEYQKQHASLTEDVRLLKLKLAAPQDAGRAADSEGAGEEVVGTLSDPLCSACKRTVAYDMPLQSLVGALKGHSKLDIQDMFTATGAVKAKSPLKKLVMCDRCMPAGALKMVVCLSGGAGNRLSCDWCRCSMTTSTTDGKSMWCGAKAHSNCRGLVIENETNRQSNTTFLSKGLGPVRDTVWASGASFALC